jgi:hypothetical protein
MKKMFFNIVIPILFAVGVWGVGLGLVFGLNYYCTHAYAWTHFEEHK